MQASFNAATTITDVAKLIGEVRDRLDIVHTSEFANFMHHLFPILRDLVVIKTSPQLEDNAENRVRHSLLEIFNKFPNNDILKPYVYEIMILSLKVLADDNEENAIIALKIIFDLHKTFRPSLEQYILPFLDTVSRLYANMPAASRSIYGSNASMGQTSALPFVRSVESFKVLTECPIIVMLLFQFYPRFVAKTMTQMVPVMLNTLSLSPTVAASVIVYPMQRQRYREFLAAQVKTLSFLTFLLRSYSDFLKTFEPSIVKSVLMLLQRCPEESVGTRRELLIATRYILTTDFRRGFHSHLDDLLDENLLLGPGRPQSLRPVAYFTITDLVHHMKDTLSITQIVTVTNMLAVTIQDLTLPVILHVSAVRALFTIVERLQLTELGEDTIPSVQYLLHHIVRNFVDKLGVLRLHVQESFDLLERLRNNSNYLEEKEVESGPGSDECGAVPEVYSKNLNSSTLSSVYLFREDSGIQEQNVHDVKNLVRTILGSMKVSCQTIMSVDLAARVTSSHVTSVTSPDRALLQSIAQMAVVKNLVQGLVRLFRYAVECGGYFLQDRIDRFENPSDRNTDTDVTHRVLGNRLNGSSEQKDEGRREQGRRGDEREKPLRSNTVEVAEHVSSIAGPFSILDTQTLSHVLHSIMDCFIGSQVTAPRENYFFTASIDMLLTSYMPCVNFVCLQAIFSIVGVRIGASGGVAAWADNDAHHKKPCAFENKSALFTVFKSALRSLQRFPENETALASKLTLMICDILKIANRLPFRDLVHSNCFRFLRIIFKTLQAKQYRTSLVVFGGIFSTTLLSLESHLSRVPSYDTTLRCELLELICSMPLDNESLSAHIMPLLSHIHSSLQLRGSGAEIADLYRLALTQLEAYLEMLSLTVLSTALSSCPTIAEGLFREISRHLQPKPYPLGELACRLMGKIGSCHAFLKASYTHTKSELFNGSSTSDSYSSLSIEAVSCLFPLDSSKVVCGSVSLGLDHVIGEACAVFEYAPILPLPSPTSTSSSSGTSTELSVSYSFDITVKPILARPYKSGVRTKKGTAIQEFPDAQNADEKALSNSIDLFQPCLDTKVLQEENSRIIDAARCQYRMDALGVLEGAVSCILAPLRAAIQSINDIDCSAGTVPSGGRMSRSEMESCYTESESCRPLLARVLCAVHWASCDPRFEERARSTIMSVFSFVLASRSAVRYHTDDLSGRVVRNVTDAMYDGLLMTADRIGLNVSPKSTRDIGTSTLLREWLCALSDASNTEKGFTGEGGRETHHMSSLEDNRAERSLSLPPDDPSVQHLLSRCLAALCGDTWEPRVAAAHVLHGVCDALPPKGLHPNLGAMIDALLSAFEYPFSLMGLCGVESLLRTLRAVINASLSGPRSLDVFMSRSASNDSTCDDVRVSASVTVKDENNPVEKSDDIATDNRNIPRNASGALTIDDRTLLNLVSALFHPAATVGVAARCALGEISKIVRCKGEAASVSALLFPLRDQINREIGSRLKLISGAMANADQGIISGLTYCYNLSPPLIDVTPDVISLFTATLHRTENEVIPPPPTPFVGGAVHRDPIDDDLLLSLQCHPYPVHPTVTRRLLFVRLTHALCSAASLSACISSAVLNDNNKDALQRSFGLLFKGLGSAWDDVGGWSQRTLHLLIGLKSTPHISSEVYETIFPRDLLQQCLQPLLVPLSSPRKVSLNGIRGVECVLRLVTNVKFLQFSDKILEHMRMFMDPEKLVALNLWENDTEEWIASGLLDLLHLLPWLPSGNSSAPPVQDPHPAGGTVSAKQVLRTFLYNFATTVSDLDMVWRKFRPSASSPFIYPFAKFLTRYPVEAVKFFFSAERILDQELCDMLLQVLDTDCPCLSKFEKILASSDSLILLSKVCLAPFLKLAGGKDRDRERDDENECDRDRDRDKAVDRKDGECSTTNADSPDVPVVDPKRDPNRSAIPSLKLGPPSTDAEANEQRAATLAYNALRLLKKLSERCPSVLYNNPPLLMILRQLVPVCFEISEKTQTNPHQHNPLTFLGPGPPPHHRATLHMETAYRNAHKLRLLCEIIIQYCRTNPANASSSQSSETFELMTFSLLPVLTMKLCAVDFTFLSDFFKSEIPLLCTSAAAKKQILRRSFGVVAGKRASVALKVKVVQVVALPLLINIFLEKDAEDMREKTPKGTELEGGIRDLCLESNSTVNSSNNSSSRSSITNSTVLHVFDTDMIQLIMLDVIGMTSHGMGAATQGATLERTSSQEYGRDERDKEREKEEGKEAYSRSDGDDRPGEDLEKGRKKDGGDRDSVSAHSDTSSLKIELLKISTLFLEHLFPLFKLFKKDIIKFAWNHIKADDSATRHWAYINICRFVASFDSPPKIIIQVYVALLRSFHPEGRELIRRALDTLVPVLPSRLLPEDFSKVVKWTKKILADDGYSMPQLCHIWHMIIRFSNVFYSYRSQLVPQMLNAISRIGLSNAATEYRLVAVAIADLVIKWEIQKPEKMPVYMVGSLPSLLTTPPLPLMRKRLQPEDSNTLTQGPRGRIDSDSSVGNYEEEDRAAKKMKREGDPQGGTEGGTRTDTPGMSHYTGKAEDGSGCVVESVGEISTWNVPRNAPISAADSKAAGVTGSVSISAGNGNGAGVASSGYAPSSSFSSSTSSSAAAASVLSGGESRKRPHPFSGHTTPTPAPLTTSLTAPGTSTGGGTDGHERQSLATQRPQGAPQSGPSGADRDGADDAYTLPRALVQTLANFVMRLCLFASDNKDAVVAKLSSRCLRLFQKMSVLPAMRTVSLHNFGKVLQNALDSFNAALAQSATVETSGILGQVPVQVPPTALPAEKSSTAPNANPTSTSTSTSSSVVTASATSTPAAVIAKTPQGQSNSGSSSSSSRASPQGFSDIMLCNFLDIATSSLTCSGGPNKLFEQNAHLLKELHIPVFSSENIKVHECYKSFLRVVLNIYPCSLSVPAPLETSGFLKQLVAVVSLGLKVKVSCLKEAQSLLLLLQAVSAMCGVQHSLVENFGSALLRIGHVMLGDHVQGAVGRAARRRRARTGIMSSQSDIRSDIASREFYESPCLTAVLSGTENEGKRSPKSRNENDSTEGKRVKDDGSSNPLEDLSGKILTCCLCVLFQSIDRGCLEQQKPVVVSLLAATVEGVDNMLLVNLASTYCLKWIGHPCSPLSLGEQVVVFSRICCHSMKLQADCKQAVLARFAAVSERIGQLTCSSTRKQSSSSFDNSDYRLGPLALLSPVRSLSDSCRARVFKQWGPSLFERLEGLFSSDLSSQFHGQWPTLITVIGLDALDPSNLTVLAGGIRGDIRGCDIMPSVQCKDRDTDCAVRESCEWMKAMSGFIASNAPAGHLLCVAMLQAMWTDLDDVRRNELLHLAANNFLQARHSVPTNTCAVTSPTSFYTTNTIPQQLLSVLIQLTPTPMFTAELLSCLGHFGCETEAVPLLDNMVMSACTERDSKQSRTALLGSLDRVEDRDIFQALLRTSTASRVTDLAVSLESYGRYDLAQSVVLQGIAASSLAEGYSNESDWAADNMKHLDDMNKGSDKMYAKEEHDVELWECRWINYAKDLSEWSMLSNFAAAVGVHDLSLECAVTLGDWDEVKRLKSYPVSALSGGGLKAKVFDGMLSLVERRYSEVSEIISDAAQLAMCRWQLQPSGGGASSYHRSIISSMQHILELDEGKNMLLTSQNCSTSRILPDLSSSLAVWRERIPDKADTMRKWDSLLHWRAQLFACVTRIFRGVAEDARLAAVTDAHWSTLQLVSTARRHGLIEVGLRTAHSVQSITSLDVTDAFSKVREQVLFCLSSNEADSTTGGLNIVNTTNLDFFCPDQRAEMFRLKGVCNRQLGYFSEAQDCFSRSVQLGGGKRGRDWLSWGHLSYDMWMKEVFEDIEEVVQGGDSDALPLCVEHATSSIVCVLKAAECGSAPGNMLLPRVLWILDSSLAAADVKDTVEYGMRDGQLRQLLSAFTTQASEIPQHCWLPYLDHLVRLLSRQGGELLLPLLETILTAHPQAVISRLRDVSARREWKSSGENTEPTDTQQSDAELSDAPSGRTDGIEDPLQALIQIAKQSHGALWSRIGWLSEVIQSASNPCELDALKMNLTALSEHVTRSARTAGNMEEVKNVLLKGLASCLQRTCSPDSSVELSAAHSRLIAAISSDFQPSTLRGNSQSTELSDMGVKNETGNSGSWVCNGVEEKSVSDILARIQLWLWRISDLLRKSNPSDSIYRRESALNSAMPPNMYNYFEFEGAVRANSGVSLPTQHLAFGAQKDFTPKVIRVCSGTGTLGGTLGQGGNGRRVRILCSDGLVHRFNVAMGYGQEFLEARAQERYSGLTAVVNWSLEQHIPSRGRALRVQGPHVSCVGGGVTLTQDRDIPSLEGIYLDHCCKSHQDPTWLSSTSLKYVLNEDMQAESKGDSTAEDRMRRVYSEACKAIPSTVLRDRFTQSCRSLNESYSARREYSSQLGLNAAMQYLLSAPAPSARDVLVCCKSGTMMNMGVTPQYKENIDGETVLQRNLDLPFRMTRNVVGVLSGTFVLGGTTLSLGLFMDACLANRDVLEVCLSLLVGEDIAERRKSALRRASSDLTLVKALSTTLLDDMVSKAPSTMIREFDANRLLLESSQQKFKGPSLPVDIHVQELLKFSMSDDNIIKLDDIAWLPWM